MKMDVLIQRDEEFLNSAVNSSYQTFKHSIQQMGFSKTPRPQLPKSITTFQIAPQNKQEIWQQNQDRCAIEMLSNLRPYVPIYPVYLKPDLKNRFVMSDPGFRQESMLSSSLKKNQMDLLLGSFDQSQILDDKGYGTPGLSPPPKAKSTIAKKSNLKTKDNEKKVVEKSKKTVKIDGAAKKSKNQSMDSTKNVQTVDSFMKQKKK
ncbi:hypothetical protein pb186bvf_006472 [Paramecium bursaria]